MNNENSTFFSKLYIIFRVNIGYIAHEKMSS